MANKWVTLRRERMVRMIARADDVKWLRKTALFLLMRSDVSRLDNDMPENSPPLWAERYALAIEADLEDLMTHSHQVIQYAMFGACIGAALMGLICWLVMS